MGKKGLQNNILWFRYISGRAKTSQVFNDEPFRSYKKQVMILKDTLPQQSPTRQDMALTTKF